jgi:hypothetical protein
VFEFAQSCPTHSAIWAISKIFQEIHIADKPTSVKGVIAADLSMVSCMSELRGVTRGCFVDDSAIVKNLAASEVELMVSWSSAVTAVI